MTRVIKVNIAVISTPLAELVAPDNVKAETYPRDVIIDRACDALRAHLEDKLKDDTANSLVFAHSVVSQGN